jgi:phosphodiesterase/alkaline phosphatase D-like protein
VIGRLLGSAILTAAANAAIWLALPEAALAGVAFTGVAAGDMTATDAILWTRTADAAGDQPVAAALTAQLSAEPGFGKILFSYKGASDARRAGTAKIDATGLAGHTRGAMGPDRKTGHDFATVKAASDKLTADQHAAGIAPIYAGISLA